MPKVDFNHYEVQFTVYGHVNFRGTLRFICRVFLFEYYSIRYSNNNLFIKQIEKNRINSFAFKFRVIFINIGVHIALEVLLCFYLQESLKNELI